MANQPARIVRIETNLPGLKPTFQDCQDGQPTCQDWSPGSQTGDLPARPFPVFFSSRIHLLGQMYIVHSQMIKKSRKVVLHFYWARCTQYTAVKVILPNNKKSFPNFFPEKLSFYNFFSSVSRKSLQIFLPTCTVFSRCFLGSRFCRCLILSVSKFCRLLI